MFNFYNIYCYPPLFVSLLFLGLGIFVFFKNKSSSINKTFFALHIAVFMWLFGFFLLYSTTDYDFAKIISKFLYTGVTFIPILFFHFVYCLLAIRDRKKMVIIQYIIGLLFLSVLYTSDELLVGVKKYYWGYETNAGFLNHIFLIYFFCIFIYCFILLRNKIKDPRVDALTKNKVRYIFWSFVIALLASTDWLPVYGIEFYPVGFIFMTFFALITSYAILKHRLFDIDIIIRRSFIYSLLISIITFIYLVLILISEYLFRSYFGYASIFTALTISSIVAIVFNPLRSRIQKFLDKHFFKIDPEKIMEENVKLMDAVQKQDQMKAVATLAAGMAHEIKNPLTSIKTFAEYLPQRYDDPEFRRKFSKIVVDEVDRVNNIVKQLLEFSKPKDLELRPESIISILDDTLNLLNSNLLKNKIEVVKSYKDDPVISVDKNQLKQAFLNLFLNSIQAMPNGGILTVSTSLLSTDSCLLITISDTGLGIPKDQLEHVFDPFFSTKEDGTGLGLSIVHGIITKHGGEIKVGSEINKGTAFNIRMSLR